jgi:GNAT superfamily N-acetyltransferase
VLAPDFSHLTIAGGKFIYQSHPWQIDRVTNSREGFFEYKLTRESERIGEAKCQPSSLIRANLTGSDAAKLSVDPIAIQQHQGQCHWIETLQIFPAFRGQGYGSLWLEALCALLHSEAKLPIVLYADEWWDEFSPLKGNQFNAWYERHGFLPHPVNGLMTLRIRQ